MPKKKKDLQLHLCMLFFKQLLGNLLRNTNYNKLNSSLNQLSFLDLLFIIPLLLGKMNAQETEN